MSKNEVNLDLSLEVEVKDINGKVTLKRQMQSQSLVTAFMETLRAWFAGSSTGKDVNGITQTIWGYLYTNGWATTGESFCAMNIVVGSTDYSYGIQIGTTDTPVTNIDYRLETLIVHGSGSGQMYYNDTTIESIAGIAPDSSIRVIRTFTNASGNTITVREVGIVEKNGYSFMYGSWQYFYRYFLIVRDVPIAINVPHGSTLTVRYTFTVTA